MSDTADLLLLSNSTMFGRGYLEHAQDALADLLGAERRVHFAPYALADHDGYTDRVEAAFARLGISLVGLHRAPDVQQAISEARVLFVGGGNTFRLLRSLQRLGLVGPVRRRVLEGSLRYLGVSAGSNMACPTLRTTNDMPIVQPDSFDALALIPFQINPHYLDPPPDSTHMGETRERRIEEFLEENDVPVLGLREGAWLRRRGRSLRLDGLAGARLFQRGQPPLELAPGTDLAWLLEVPARFDTEGTR